MSTCIITCLFNHENNDLTNFYSFIKFIRDSNVIDSLFVVEITSDGESRLDEELKLSNHLILSNPDKLWHKEAAINRVLSELPPQYTKVVVMDNDIKLTDSYWFQKVDLLLDQYLVVQPFDFIRYYGPGDIGIDYYNKSLTYGAETSGSLDEGNPGICVGYRRDYLDSVGGLFDKCLVGGGDSVNMVPFYYDSHSVKLGILDSVFADNKVDMLDYWIAAKTYVKNSKYKAAGYVDNCVALHSYHGNLKNRQYDSRYNIINKFLSKDNIIKDTNGLYRITDDAINGGILKYSLNSFFNNRLINISYDESYIFNTTKYKVENNILWLSDYNYLSFHNIDYIKLYLHKSRHLKYFYFIYNNGPIAANFDESMCVLELEKPKNLIIDSDYFIPKLLHIGSDERKLSVYISKIEIKKIGCVEYINYPLDGIL